MMTIRFYNRYLSHMRDVMDIVAKQLFCLCQAPFQFLVSLLISINKGKNNKFIKYLNRDRQDPTNIFIVKYL